MISYERSRSLTDAVMAKVMLDSLEQHYPGFRYWYANNVMPGLLTGRDVLLVARDGARIVGVALGKKTAAETKLRCVRVLPDFQNVGVGLRLIDAMFDELGCDKPHCTVSEDMLHLYSRAFVNRYGFSLDDVRKGVYLPGKLEYSFNGTMQPKAASWTH